MPNFNVFRLKRVGRHNSKVMIYRGLQYYELDADTGAC